MNYIHVVLLPVITDFEYLYENGVHDHQVKLNTLKKVISISLTRRDHLQILVGLPDDTVFVT